MLFEGFVSEVKETFYAGDPQIREWFLIKSDYAPLLLGCTYVLLVKVVVPRLMRDRKPFHLRGAMIAYNFCVVATYLTCLTVGLYYFLGQLGFGRICTNNTFNPQDRAEYRLASCIWAGYLLKYFEFMDTIFFVLRKKEHLVTNLHVIHHTFVPLLAWTILRSETSGFQAFPALLNTMVHIVMYTYYGLAAIGPSVHKYLWWKRYLTIAQMVQFVLILLFSLVVWPMTGCPNLQFSKHMTTLFAIFFFGLFFNFYFHTFLVNKVAKDTANGHSK